MKSRVRILFGVAILAILLGSFAFGSVVSATEIDTEQQAQFTAPILVANTSFLNVRTGPNAGYSVLVTVVGGTELPVLGVFADRVWYQVSTIVGVGWVNVQFTLPRGDFSNVPFAEAPEVLNTDLSTTSILDQMAQDDATSMASFSGGREWGVSVRISHPFRTGSTMNSGSPGTILENPDIIYAIIEAANMDGSIWYRIDDPTFGLGWVEADKVQFRPFACGDSISAVVFNAPVRPTIGPDGSGTLDGNVSVDGGSEAYLIDAIGQQYKVELRDGSTGWVPSSTTAVRGNIFSSYCENGGGVAVAGSTTDNMTNNNGVTSTQPRLVGPRAVINTGFLNLRSGPGAQYSIVTTLAGGTEVQLIGVAPDGVWYLAEGTFGRAWLNSEFTLLRGDGRNLPIIRDFVGSTISVPMANITNAVTLYATPNAGGNVIGAVSGPIQVNVVARTADFNWLQVSTAIGFGWVQASQVTLAGDSNLIPIVNG